MKSNKFEFHEHKLSKKNKPINNQRRKPQTHDSKQKKPKEKDRKEKEKKLPRNSRIDQEKKKEDSKEKQWCLYLHSCPNQAENQSQSYSKEFRPEQRSRKNVLRGEAGSGWLAVARGEQRRASEREREQIEGAEA